MKKILIGMVCCALMFSVGCTSLHKQFKSGSSGVSAATAVAADLDIGKPIKGTASVSVLFNFINIGGDSEYADGVSYSNSLMPSINIGPSAKLKSAAAYKALENSGYDVILDPRYTIKRSGFYFIWEKYTCTVEGVGANIKGYRQVKDDLIFSK